MTDEPEGSGLAAEPDDPPQDMPGKLRTALTTRPTGRQVARWAPAILSSLTLGITVAVALWGTKDSAAVIGPVSTWAAITAALIGTSLAVRSYQQSQDQHDLSKAALDHSISVSSRANLNREDDNKRALVTATNTATADYLASVHHFVNAVNNLNEAISQEYKPPMNSMANEADTRQEFFDNRTKAVESQFSAFKDSYWNTLTPSYYPAYLAASQVSASLATEISSLDWEIKQIGDEILSAGGPMPSILSRQSARIMFDNVANRSLYVNAMKNFASTVGATNTIWEHLQHINALPLDKIPEIVAGWSPE